MNIKEEMRCPGTMKTLLLVAFVSGRLLAADPAVTDGMSNGKAWNGLGGGNPKTAVMLKLLYLLGLSDGYTQSRGELIPQLFSKPTPGQEEKGAEIIPDLLPKNGDLTVIIAELDVFYHDSQNIAIPIPVAARYVKGKLQGGDPKELDASLKRLRVLYRLKKEAESLYGK
jgi:hypothetical protein